MLFWGTGRNDQNNHFGTQIQIVVPSTVIPMFPAFYSSQKISIECSYVSNDFNPKVYVKQKILTILLHLSCCSGYSLFQHFIVYLQKKKKKLLFSSDCDPRA